MKTIILKIAVTVCLIGAVMPGFAQERESRDAIGANKEVIGKDSIENYKDFKARMEKKIEENNAKIAELKTKKQEGAQEVKDKYNKKVAALDKKNQELKKRINEYKEGSDDKWRSFKREFNHDMKELGHALKDMGTNNVK